MSLFSSTTISFRGRADAGVRAAAEAQVLGQREQLDPRECRSDELGAAIGGTVVHHHDLVCGIAGQRFNHRRQVFCEQVFAVPVGDHDGGGRRRRAARACLRRDALRRRTGTSQIRDGQRHCREGHQERRAASSGSARRIRFSRAIQTAGPRPTLRPSLTHREARYSNARSAPAWPSLFLQPQRPGGALLQLLLRAAQRLHGALPGVRSGAVFRR